MAYVRSLIWPRLRALCRQPAVKMKNLTALSSNVSVSLADAVRLEGLTENLRVLLLEASRLELESEALNVMPGDLPPAPSLEPVDARAVGRLRAVLSQAASALLKLPMSSTWSETEHNLAQRTRAELSASMNAAAAIAQTSLWGMPPEDFCSLVENPMMKRQLP